MKNYAELIDAEMTGVYVTGISTKILQHMDRIRNTSSLSQARRWVMELIQNAGDTADGTVRIRIEHTEDKLRFMHSGRPFRVKDILSLINQVSSKTDDDSTVGQFGTGFMTTYQLSEQVEIDSVLSDRDGEEAVSPKRFHVLLDRGGHTQQEIRDSIAKSISELKSSIESPEAEIVSGALNTVFTYHLNSDDSTKAARTGLEDLSCNILFIMLFSSVIESIEILKDGKLVTYRRGENKPLCGNVRRLEIIEDGEEHKEHYLVYSAEEDSLCAAALADSENRFLPLSDKTPRVYIMFPLIGAESFPFPVVLNHNKFNPNEPRSFITLVDNEKSENSKENKAIIERAVKLYGSFLRDCLEYGFTDFFNVVNLPGYQPRNDMSENWVKSHIYEPICSEVSAVPFIPTECGALPLSDTRLWLPRYGSSEEDAALRELCEPLKNIVLPCRGTDWAAVFESYPINNEKFVTARRLCENASTIISGTLDYEKCSLDEWCSRLYAAAQTDIGLLRSVRSGELRIFPNQYQPDRDNAKLYGISELYRDDNIPEIIKDICFNLDFACRNTADRIHLRQTLLSGGFQPRHIDGMAVLEKSRIKSFLADQAKFNNNSKYQAAMKLMISCSANNDLYDLLSRICADLPERVDIGDFYEAAYWRSAFFYAENKIGDEIANLADIASLAQAIGAKSEADTFEWLNAFYAHKPGSAKMIFPNRYGKFISGEVLLGKIFSSLPLIDKTTDSALINIAEILYNSSKTSDSSFYFIIDKRVKCESLICGALTDDVISSKINNRIVEVMQTKALHQAEEYVQQACTELMGWLTKNPGKAKSLFPSFASDEDRMKLLTVKQALGLSEKADSLDNLLAEWEVSTPEELKVKLKNYKNRESEQHFFSSSWDSYSSGEDMFGMNDTEREDFLRKVGVSGEKFALENICAYFKNDGWELQSKNPNLIKLRLGDRLAELYYPDNESYHQCGWDIRLTLEETVNGSKDIYYFEVKTHTVTSKMGGMIQFSEAQLKNVMRYKDKFIVALAEYSKHSDVCTNLEYYRDVFDCVNTGKLGFSGNISFYSARC